MELVIEVRILLGQQTKKGIKMNALQFMRTLSNACGGFMSRERDGKASNSEMKRWIGNRSVIINGENVAWDEAMNFHMESVVLFPKGKTVTIL